MGRVLSIKNVLKLCLAVIAGSTVSHAQSIGCYIGAVCVTKSSTCNCNGGDYYTQGFQAGHHGYSCDLFYGAPCASGGNCTQRSTTAITHTDGYCIGTGYQVYGKKPGLDISAQIRKQEVQEVGSKFVSAGTQPADECEIASAAFRAWIEDVLKRAR